MNIIIFYNLDNLSRKLNITLHELDMVNNLTKKKKILEEILFVKINKIVMGLEQAENKA